MDIITVIIISILILLLLIWIYLRYDCKANHSNIVRAETVNQTIKWLYQTINHICNSCNMHPIYEIKETHQITYTEKVSSPHNIKGIIYLVIWDEINNIPFNKNTLLYAMIHEISHILSPSIHHQPPFDSIENLLLSTATNLGYYNPNLGIDSNYMTLDLS